jgi:putative N6-adenine-specific DNA methylase
LLAEEVQRLTGNKAEPSRGGVRVDGDAATAMRLNLESRLAQRVLWPLIDGPYRDEHDLHDLARRVPWADWITPRQTLRVDVHAVRSPLPSLNFAALRIKDAVCDTLRELVGERPSVDTRHPDLPLMLYVGPEHATLYADTSGEALFKRGWRDATAGKGEAPLKETLAAAMLAAAGWHGREEDGPLLDPCCGAGTIAIEAAQMACGIAPGAARRFAFERQLPFRDQLPAWRQMQREARERVHAPRVPVFAGDVSFRMTDFAARNAARAGVGQAIEFKTADALQRPPPAPHGTMMLNPPYGERIAPKGRGAPGTRTASHERGAPPTREGFEGGGSDADFFAGLATHWKRHYAGWSAWLLSPDMKLPTLMRLKESRRVPLWNGPIECRLFRFDLVAGSNKPD